MIAELYLIVELLKKSSSFGRSTPSTVQQPETYGVKPTEGTTANLGGTLFNLGKIEAITQPVVIPPISKEDYTQWWIDATKDIPITSLPPKAR